MELKNLTYLFLQLSYLLIPVVLSVSSKVRFVFQLRYLFPAVVFTGLIYVMWNMRFIELGIWNYNYDYLTGIDLLDIPIEEWLSFLIVPISAAYIFDWTKIKLGQFEHHNIFLVISLLLFILMGVLAYIFRRNMFSFFTFFLTAIYLGYTVFRNRFKQHYPAFYFSWLAILIPFTVVFAIAGMLPIIAYQADQIMGVAILAVPLERFFYVFLMILITLTIYEYLSLRRYY